MTYDRDLERWRGITYECVRCRSRFDGEQLIIRGQIKCPYCSYKVLKKIRPPIVKRLKAV